MTRIVITTVVAMLACTMIGGCPAGEEGALDSTSGDGGECVEPPFDGLESNPGYRNVVTGIAAPPSTPWQSIARGKVDEPASSSGCCDDYVLGSPQSSDVTVVFGAAASGLVAFDDEPDVTVSMSGGGAGVVDVALADLDGDDRNDLLALLDDGTVGVRLGTAMAPYFEDGLVGYPASVGGATGRDLLVIGDVDCDGDPDVLMPSDEGVVVLVGDASGGLTPTSVVSSPVPIDDVALGDLDHDDDGDIVASSSDGVARVWIGECGAFSLSEGHGKPLGVGTYERTHVALGTICPSFSNSFDLIVGYGDTVDVYCGNGSGSFEGVQEAHGTESGTGADYRWQPITVYAEPRYVDLIVAGAGTSQQIFGYDGKDNDVVALVRSGCNYQSGRVAVTTSFLGAVPVPWSRLLATPDVSMPSTWERISVLGGHGMQVVR